MRCKHLSSIFYSNIFYGARYAAGLIMLASAGLLAAAFFFQYVMGLQPCVLCIYQRIPYAITFVLGLIGFCLALKMQSAKPAAFFIALCAPVFLIGMALGLYHTGVEQRWWVSALEACSSSTISLNSGDLKAQLEKTMAVRCDAIAWQMFGISMAGYNALISFALTLYSATAALLITRRANGF